MSSRPQKKFTFIFYSSIIFFAVAIFAIFFSPSYTQASSECPTGMTDEECYDYLEKKASEISKKQGSVKSKIDGENNKQATLSGQIATLNYSIQQTELNIEEAENQIAKHETKIRILARDIVTTQKEIDALTAEIEQKETQLQRQAFQSYLTRFRSPLEAVLNAKDFTSMIRRLKYLQTLRDQFRLILGVLQSDRTEEENKRNELKEQKEKVEVLKKQIEEEKAALESEKKTLDTQRAEEQYLYSLSKKTEAEYQTEYNTLKAQADIVDKQLTEIIFRLFKSGQLKANTPVTKGQTIGFQGHTGCSFGSHLHFGISSGSAYYPNVNPFSKGYFSGASSYGSIIGSSSYSSPMSGAKITQGFHSGYALDLISTLSGYQGSDRYYKAPGTIKCPTYVLPTGYNTSPYYGSLKGEGAAVKAVSSGKVSKSQTDQYGGKYLVVDHLNGEVSLYLHLR